MVILSGNMYLIISEGVLKFGSVCFGFCGSNQGPASGRCYPESGPIFGPLIGPFRGPRA